MATFQLSKKNKKQTNKNIKIIFGWTLLALSTFIFLFSVTKLIPFLQYFFLGLFGIFVYPFSLLGFFISLALLNNKKYVMPKKYAIFLALSLILFLMIIQLIIIGSPKNLSYGQYVGLNYTKQFTAGGIIIGFIPASMAYLMGLPVAYVLLSIAFIVSITFFIESVISLRKTTDQQKPIRLQIKEEKIERNIPFSAKEKNPKIKEEKEATTNVMFDGYKQKEEQKELTAREKLGLVGGYKQKVGQTYEQKEIKLPEEKEAEGKIPTGMSIREYLLSPPKVDLEKFKEQSKIRASRPAYSYDNNFSSDSRLSTINNLSNSEINSNLNELKSTEDISPKPNYENNDNFVRQGNLPDVKPEEITNEAETIIRSVVMQEKLEREESPIEENYQEEKSLNDKEFINFDDIEEQTPQEKEEDIYQNSLEKQKDETILSGQNLLRENTEKINQENNFDESLDRHNQRDLSRQEFAGEGLTRERLKRENISDNNENNNKGSFNSQMRERPLDEMERRKRFVSLDEDNKKEEKIVPYKYNRPSLELLTTVSDDPASFNPDMPMKRVALENVLENFGIPAKVQNVVVGPTVTRYEIEMPEGISVKKILSLDADIAYALSANGQIRIEAPIPGRSMVGIEVPNAKVAKVSIKDVLQSKEFALSPSPLTFALGKDITGNVKVCNLQKMPHLLVAGTTGSGKSVCLNTIITSLIYKSSPDEVKFIMIDPKQVELSMYEGLPHMVVPRVITDPTKAVNALQWAVDEMERRFRLISEEKVRNIDEYNKIDKVLQNKVKKMPYIVIIFDEFADFMAVAKNEIEDKIRRLAGKARAAGIHLILATQRPSTDVVTGTLKANLPARIAFKVAGRVDSEVIMGATGAEKLLGHGDMLYKPADSEPQRLQGCLIETQETKDVVNYITENNEEIFDEEAFNAINNPGKSSNGNGGNENNGVDPLLPNALKICIDNGFASTTMVQRKLAIGYPRAARIIDQMEERGYISSAEGSKQRSVYISIEEFYSIFGDIYD